MKCQMDVFPINLDDFFVSNEYGFLLEDPLEHLPDYFAQWNTLAKAMPTLVTEKKMRYEVGKLPVLDYTKLNGHRQYRLAHLQLCLIAAGYIWQEGDKGATKVLPASISVPWYGVSSELGLPPVLCHASLMLANWRIDKQGQVHCIYCLPGGVEADWFLSVTAEVELAFAAGLKNLLSLLYEAQSNNVDGVTKCLHQLTQTISDMKAALSKMHENLSAETFYNTLRPYLAGWGGDGSPLPDGIIYKGILEKPVKMIGGSAAQSSTLQSIDAALGIVHKDDIREFMGTMRSYMPPAHKRFIDTLEKHSQVKQMVWKHNCDKLKSAYNTTLEAVMNFRSYHIQIVTKYIVLMANKETRSKDYEALASKGTGGSSLLPFLKSLRSTTSECLMSGSQDATEPTTS